MSVGCERSLIDATRARQRGEPSTAFDAAQCRAGNYSRAVGYRLNRAATLKAIRNAILTMSPDRRIKLPVTEIKPELKAESETSRSGGTAIDCTLDRSRALGRTVQGLQGHSLNPYEPGKASKVALATYADYFARPGDYAEESWESAMQRVAGESRAPHALLAERL